MKHNTTSKEFKYRHADRRQCRTYSLQLYLDEPNCFRLIQIFIDWTNRKNADPEYNDSFIKEVVFIKHDKDVYDKDVYKDVDTDQRITIPRKVKDIDKYLKEHPNIIVEHKKGDLKKPHYHAVLYLHNYYTRLKLSIKYNIPITFIECCDYKYANEMLLYLTHVKQPKKYPYPIDSVIGYKGGVNYLRCLDYNTEEVDTPSDYDLFCLAEDFIKDNCITCEHEVIKYLLSQKFPLTHGKARQIALDFTSLYRINREDESRNLLGKDLENKLSNTKDIIQMRMNSIEYNEKKKLEDNMLKFAKFLYHVQHHQQDLNYTGLEFISDWYDTEYVETLPETDDFKEFYSKFSAIMNTKQG